MGDDIDDDVCRGGGDGDGDGDDVDDAVPCCNAAAIDNVTDASDSPLADIRTASPLPPSKGSISPTSLPTPPLGKALLETALKRGSLIGSGTTSRGARPVDVVTAMMVVVVVVGVVRIALSPTDVVAAAAAAAVAAAAALGEPAIGAATSVAAMPVSLVAGVVIEADEHGSEGCWVGVLV